MRRPARETIEIALDLAGLALLALAGWLVAPALGLALAGLACLILANGGIRRPGGPRRDGGA